jgi:hypothetical protein
VAAQSSADSFQSSELSSRLTWSVRAAAQRAGASRNSGPDRRRHPPRLLSVSISFAISSLPFIQHPSFFFFFSSLLAHSHLFDSPLIVCARNVRASPPIDSPFSSKYRYYIIYCYSCCLPGSAASSAPLSPNLILSPPTARRSFSSRPNFSPSPLFFFFRFQKKNVRLRIPQSAGAEEAPG